MTSGLNKCVAETVSGFRARFGAIKTNRGCKTFSCSHQHKFVILVNFKLITIANSFLLNIAEHDIFSASKYENANFGWHFHIYKQRKFQAQLS